MPPRVAIGTLRSGLRTTPATIAPVSRPMKAQNTTASEPKATMASDSPLTFQPAPNSSGLKWVQPATRIAATGSRPKTTQNDWKRAMLRGPSRLSPNIAQISSTWPARRTPSVSSIGSRMMR